LEVHVLLWQTIALYCVYRTVALFYRDRASGLVHIILASYSQPCRLVATIRESPVLPLLSFSPLRLFPPSPLPPSVEKGGCLNERGVLEQAASLRALLREGGGYGVEFRRRRSRRPIRKKYHVIRRSLSPSLRPPFVRPGFGLSYCLTSSSLSIYSLALLFFIFKEYQT
jgi:hypothetical protein